MTVKVMIADDQELLRTGFRLILERQSGVQVVAEATDGSEAVAQARIHQPDVILMDIRMPGVDGIQATRVILADPATAHARILILTTFDLDEYVYDALRAGASGFLLKDLSPERLVDAVMAAPRGEALLAPSVTRRLIEHFTVTSRAPDPPAAVSRLTRREGEVLRLLAQGLSNSEIATQLFVAETTVKTHVARLLTKLDLRDRVQAVVYSYQHGLVHDSRGGAQ